MPEKPRKSRLGRLTHCTGKRNGLAAAIALDVDGLQVSTRAGPAYQGILSDLVVTLSPKRADIGIGVMVSKPSVSAKAR